MQIPFKKFRGREIEDTPSSYLYWIINNVKPKNAHLRRVIKACDDEYNWREKYHAHFEDD